MKNTVLHKANTRGNANHGWLNAYHSFSFASWYNPERVQFGVLRVLNDDTIAAGMGFGTHPHDNMEIITIPLEGDLAHKDSMGNAATIKTGDVQVMSAGTGIQHSEFNPNADQQTKLFQIWLFPKTRNVEPRYQQITLDKSLEKNDFAQILSPNADDAGVWIHQDAWFYLSDFDKDFSKKLPLKKEGNGFYIMNIEGEIEVNGEKLEKRDAIGIWETAELEIKANTTAKFLIMEIPMEN
ncbi:MAG TPA: pirin family protein [Flavobacterium sp.]|jgi:redox-sensitive bicupin YhaK (pirin superfamily)|uniref:pirin family protein n=1 Tax=Flavobacterium sp. TaxID=239 RepID=UPI002C23CDE3|nr:pirin family protein [Flavobacterium sp.]MCA0348844.1 pirin family protein [Bacteroidota bacterium]HPW98468.1 pirin family protein [Flavobacterium sp.]HQA74629.1 pirin family protein [Flavobacterium sp.]